MSEKVPELRIPAGLLVLLRMIPVAFWTRIGKTKHWKRAGKKRMMAWDPREVHKFFQRMLGQKEE